MNAKHQSVRWGLLEQHYDDPIEQQTPQGAMQPDRSLWVLHPPLAGEQQRPVWDPDDSVSGAFVGSYFDPDVTVDGEISLLADDSPHLAYLTVPAGLVGTISLEGYLSLEVLGGRSGCILGPQFAHPSAMNPSVYPSPMLLPVEGSNGGCGQPLTVRFTLTNVSGRRLRDIVVWAKVTDVLGWNAAPCPWPLFTYGTPLYPAGNDPQVWSWLG